MRASMCRARKRPAALLPPGRAAQAHTLGVGSIPRSIVVALEHDLVDTCKAGDDAVVTGTLTRRWSRIARGARCDLEVLIKANHVRIISDSHAGGIVTDGERGESSRPQLRVLAGWLPAGPRRSRLLLPFGWSLVRRASRGL